MRKNVVLFGMNYLIKLSLVMSVIGLIVIYDGSTVSGSDYPTNEASQEKVDELLKKLNSNDPLERSRAIYDVFSMYYYKKIKIKEAIPVIIEELENIDWEHLTEGSGEYGGDLIEMLGEFGDKRAIEPMLNALGHAGGSMITDAFAKMGPDMLDPLIKRMEKGKRSVKLDGLFYLGRMPGLMKKYSHRITGKHKTKIKNMIKKSFSDEDDYIRKRAVEATGKVQDIYDYDEIQDLIPILKRISRKDSHVIRRKKAGVEQEIYPIREEALKVLEKIKTKKNAEESLKEKNDMEKSIEQGNAQGKGK